ncbi:MAG: L,D-transpeptidase family protein [Acidimicrobiales bacterium]|nr:L,D-transpeptidase family protein [Acidimicrobiales bacterium]
MERRRFLLSTGAVTLAACAHPERDLVARYTDVDIRLEPAGRGTLPSSGDSQPTEAASDSPYPVQIPEEDLPGIVFVAEALTPVVTASQTLGSGEVDWEFTNPISSGGPLVFVIEEFDDLNNFRVLLPTRPNGSFGWISANDIKLTRHNFRLQIDLDAFHLTLFNHEEEIWQATIGVARENAPTPSGRYYTTELLRPPTPHSVYGTFAYGLSGFSEVFMEFAGGPGQLGIHGTNDPDTLGSNVSSGCIRLHNDDISYLVESVGLPLGVPVDVI